jgi:hypothetical protein
VWDAVVAEVAAFPAAVRDSPVMPTVAAAALRAGLTEQYPFDAAIRVDVNRPHHGHVPPAC